MTARATTRDVMEAAGPRMSRKQIDSIRQSRAQINIWTGAIRSGKTISSLMRWLMFVRHAPTSGQLVMIGKTKDTLNRNIFAVLTDPAIFGALASEVHYTPGSGIAVILGRVVHVIGANDARSESRLRGMTIAGAYVDEITLLPRDFWVQLLGRMSGDDAKLFGTTNPDNPAHFLRRDYLSRAHEPAMNLRHWHFTIDDNPALSAAKKASYKAQFTGLFYKRFILGAWVAAEGAVYDMWDEDRHVIDDVPLISRWIAVGVDYGTKNPFAALAVGLGADRKLYVVDEYRYDSAQHHRQKSPERYAEALRGWVDNIEQPGTAGRADPYGNTPAAAGPVRGIVPEMVAVDPSAAEFIATLSEDPEGRFVPTKARNDVTNGILTVSSLLTLGRLYVHRRCKGLIDEFPGYAWHDEKAKLGEDVPIKVDDHSLDALRYALFTSQGNWRPHVMWDLAA
ncbi:PBSX family phage terminase large subunit [Micromonospora haikouensis]|uniref:PBSX family phage terminase large subunit n=2 Tax=Actinomycetes TaxID=1760 RepID=UPI0033C80E6C